VQTLKRRQAKTTIGKAGTGQALGDTLPIGEIVVVAVPVQMLTDGCWIVQSIGGGRSRI
jgi:hypothetical protein